MSKLFIYCNYSYIVIIQFFSMIYCIGSRCRRVAALNRKVSIISLRGCTNSRVNYELTRAYVFVWSNLS